MNEFYLYLGLAAIVVIMVAVIIRKNTKAKLSKDGSKMDKIDFFMNPVIVKLIIITSMYLEEVE